MKRQERVVIIDDNEALLMSIRDYFKDSKEVKIVGIYRDGKDALNYLANHSSEYDLLVMDLILSRFDGLKILEELKNNNINKKIIVLSSFKDDFTIRKVQSYGANYFMLKPVDIEVIASRIKDLAINEEGNESMRVGKIELEVSNLLHDLGIPSHIRGYKYIREGVLLLYENEDCSAMITKDIYPQIANKYETTISRVERAIRHAIEISWTRGDLNLMNELFGNSVDCEKSRPTNSEFLETIADRFKINDKLIAV